ncbi:MAG: homoserine kinase [Acidimicrobiia bacterium]|nr:homoserine kinase [Acidimicrobiia bacterium]
MIGEASAPASSANLGPGFDTLALALGLRCTARAEPAVSMTITEGGSTRRLADDDRIVRAVDAAVGQPMHITLDNEIPRARGLGSSAAVVASVAAASMKAVKGRGDAASVYQIVVDLEGHADNAAAAVFGGLVAVATDGVQRLDLHPDLQPVVGIPSDPLPTRRARAALDDSVSRDIAVRTLQRLAFLVSGLASGNAETLAHAAGDELHERPRSTLSPVTDAMIEAAYAAGAMHACWSGAGPTALALVSPESKGRVIGALSGVLGSSGEVLALPVDRVGVR